MIQSLLTKDKIW